MSVFVRFWGTRGSIPTPGQSTRRFGGNTSCVEIRFDDTVFVCDGGTGLRELGLDLMRRDTKPVVVHMLFSHMHWDHIQGFPFFVPAYAKGSALHVYEVSPGDDRVRRLLHGQMRSEYFPVTFGDLDAAIQSGDLGGGEREICGVTVRCIEQTHPGRSFAYSFEKDGTKIVYATDNELDLTIENRQQADADPELLRQLPESFVRFVAGSDLLIADGQYTDAEYSQKVGWGHARSNTVADLAVQGRVRQCAIYHHDPMQTDEAVDAKIARARARAGRHAADLVVFGAREGLELKF